MRKALLNSNGFSVVELLVSSSIGLLFLTSVLGAWNYSTAIWKQENVQTGLRFNLESAIEKIKSDVRLSDANKTLYYPASSAGPYTAISMPGATRDSNGFFTISSGITWSKTVIYHVYPNNGKQELRRTVYNSFNSNNAARQAQLDNVVASGGDQGNATTTAIGKADTISFSINSSTPTFDGYSSSNQLSAITDFGNVRLSSGAHQIKFLVTGKNALSSGYRMGIDALTLSPSGGSQEAEALTFTSVSPTAVEDMSAFGGWGGNYHVECQSGAAGDSITFTTNYDQWLESNFENMTYSSSAVYGTDPHLSVQSREDQGLAPSWNIAAQTQAPNAFSAGFTNKSIRCVIAGASITKPATMIRIKFLAGDAPLVVNSAYFGQRSLSTANFAGGTTQLYFNNGTVQEGGSDGVGAVGTTGPTSITIPAGYYAWSNWFEYPITLPVAGDFLVSMYVSAGNASAWTDPTITNTHSYQVDDSDGSYANTTDDWATLPNFQANPTGYAVAEMAAWVSTGVATSQVYDTKMASPAYSELRWETILPSGSSVNLKIRTSGSADMSGAADWSALAAHASSPASLGGLANLRYVQFQATLQAASPYASFPEVDDVKITWPGQTALVNISGRFTKKPNYGTFQVLVDGVALVKALTANLTLSSTYRGKTITESLGSEVKAKNTGR